MIERYGIAGYCRISVDEELDRDNTSIENQKAIIANFVKQKFPDSTLAFYEDRDRSGYTFDQRPGYQAMCRELMSHQKDILIVKDFSRFSRRNGRGLVELEDLRDGGVRIISIGENVDFPNDDDWLRIQFTFIVNEMPVTDTSKKVKAVIKRRRQEIVDYRTFATARALRQSRSTAHYRGQKKYDNVYSGVLYCGDCGSPMFAMSRRDVKDAYRCGTYHRRGLKGCTSHHIRVDKLDELLKFYVQKIKDNSAAMLERLNTDLVHEEQDVAETEQSAANLETVLADLQEELKATRRQRIRDIMKHPGQEDTLEETYDELESDLLRRMEGLQNQIAMTVDKRNTIIQVNRAAKTALEVLDDILTKPKLERNDLQLIIQRIVVYEDHVCIQLQEFLNGLLREGTLPKKTSG